MSKIIESVMTAQNEKEVAKEKSSYELTQEQLSDIYFAATGKTNKPDAPIIIKVIEKPRMASVIPWIITSIAFLITAFSLFSSKRVFVDVKIIDEKSPYWTGMQSETPVNTLRSSTQTYHEDASADVQHETIPLQDFVFEGAAKLKSTAERSTLSLVNTSVAPFARANIYFDPPIDLKGAKIVFAAKGYQGGENVAFALKDEGNVLAFSKGKTYPFPNGLGVRWQKAEITLDDAVTEFDQSRIRSLRFDFGSKDTENKSGDTIFIKDLQIVRTVTSSSTN